LAAAVKMIGESPLGAQPVLTGGTALHHCYLPQHHFSENLGFSALTRGLSLETVGAAPDATGQFTVKSRHESRANNKIERFRYAGLLVEPEAIEYARPKRHEFCAL
jgi:predicted nucleotidyltransferase component of viral defense system